MNVLSRINMPLDLRSGYHHFSKIDLRSAYHQIFIMPFMNSKSIGDDPIDSCAEVAPLFANKFIITFTYYRI
jgi:hypothetical protein